MSNLILGFKNVVNKYRDKGITIIKPSKEEIFLSYNDLYNKSLEFAYLAKENGLNKGDKLILQISDIEKFFISFWGCIVGGIIPIPLETENIEKTINVFNVLEEAKILTENSNYSTIQNEIKDSQLIFNETNCMIFENLMHQLMNKSINQNDIFVDEDISDNDTAFIQFSSGTTGIPKGVVLSHRNLLTNIYDIVNRCELTSNEKALSWLPLTHNMGLIGLHITPLLIGAEQCFINTEVFMRNPIVWMEKADKYKSTILASPNFGYIHFMQQLKVENELNYNWDLSSIRIVYNGAESISLSVINEFCNYMQKWKLKKEVMYPVYGLAEATLAVTFPNLYNGISYKEIDRNNIKIGNNVNYTGENSNMSFTCINLGYAMDNCNLKICDDQGNELGEEHVGHIIVSGKSIMSGYYKNEKETENILDENGNLNTGDLGFISDGNLYIIGRSKEMIIVNGKNYYPEDIEMLLYTTIKDIEANKVIAVSVNHREEKESLAIFMESERDIESCLPVIDKIRSTLFSRLKLRADFVIVVNEIKKTSSGKLQRLVYKSNFENNEYEDIINLIASKQNMNIVTEYVAPKTELERKILDLVKKELKINLNFGLEKGIFDLGFDSLQISKLVNSIENDLSVTLTLEDVLANKTLKSLCDFINKLDKITQIETEKLGECEYYATSPAQKRIYTINRTNPLSTDYNITQSIIINREIDEQQFEQAYNNVLNLHDILFTSYHLVDGNIVQKVHENRDSIFEYHEVKSDKDINDLIDRFVKPFDIVKPPLIRGMLIKINNSKYCFTIDVHHIVADGLSLVTLFKQILNSYEGTLYNKNSIQQKNVVLIQRDSLEANIAELKEYWNFKFQKEIPIIDLPFDNPIYDMKNNKAGRYVFTVNNEITVKLKEIARLQNVSTFSVLLSSFYILLNKVTNQKDIVIGVPISGRKRYMPRDIVGMFVNTVPFRIDFDDNRILEELFQTVSADFKNAMEYQDYAIENLVDDLRIRKEANRNYLFDVMFSYYNMSFGSDRGYVEKYNYKNNDAQFFITMNVEDTRKELSVEIEYYKELFDSETIERLAETYLKILNSIICNRDSKIKDLESITEYEKDLILNKFNSKKVELSDDASIYHLIEENVLKTPNKLAIIYKSKEITYDEMNKNANRIGHMLVEAGLKTEAKVGILLERNPMMLESILGIWKVGGAYIPIDVNYPLERISDIYEMSQAEFLLTESKYLSSDLKDKLQDVKIICLDEIVLENYSKNNLNMKYSVDCMAYIIFTSGSTGKPKGAIVEQIGMYNHMMAKIDDLNLNEDSVILQSASHCFDISVWQFFAALVSGGVTVIIPNESIFDINEYLHLINQYNISIVQVVPSFLNVIIKKLNEKLQKIDSVKYMIVTGERVNSDTVSNWFGLNTGIPLVNAYGPTEAADDITHYIMHDDPKEVNISVGKPIQNMNIYIVDENMNLCGIGVRGEICTSGIGVGRGYIGDEEKTNKVFLKDPFQSNYPYRMYKTGDIGRWLPNGNIEFLERKDYQVKIHGYRIELGEIETKILENKKIREVKVLDRENNKNEKFLCAYFVSQENVDIEQLKEEINNKLPNYMVPQYFIRIDKMPISNNGKVERKVLLSIPIQTVDKKHTKPQTWTQKKIALIWREVLELYEIGIEDNFFEVGGHSLKAITMMDYFQNEFEVDFNINDVFNYDTIEKQAIYIDKRKNNNKSDQLRNVIEKNTLNEYELSSAQKRIFAVSQADGESCIAYNMPALFRIEGIIDYSKVEKIFKDLIKRHSNLRVNFKLSENNITQIINNNVDFVLDKMYIDENDTQKIYSKLVKPFDIFNELLFRASIITNNKNENFLFIDMHHIISDGISINILVDEFIKLYDNKTLNILEYEYCDFIAWQNKKSKGLEGQERYWIEKFRDHSQRMQLATDYTRGATNSFEGKSQTFVLDMENTSKLKKFALETESTLFMILMTAYKVLLYKYTNSKDIIVGTVSAGRRRKEFRDIVGMFVNTIPVKTTLKENDTFKSYLEIVKKAILEGLSNEEYQFNDLVEKLQTTRDSNSNPIFDVLFVMQDDYVDTLKSEYLTLKYIDFKNTMSKFDLEFQVTEIENKLVFDLSYKCTLYKDETITNFLNHYKEIIRQIIDESNILIEEIEIITDREKELIKSFNDTSNDYKSDLSIIDLFESNVKRNSNAIALRLDDKSLSYKELNDRANQRVHKLIEKGISSGDIVAIMMEDSMEMIDCILAILKLGAVYLPIDTKLPIKRIELMLIETEAKLLVYDDSIKASFDVLVPMMNINEDITSYPKDNLHKNVKGETLACIIYTSGTSGTPKGNLVMHKNIIRVVYKTNYVEITDQDVILQTANYGFDGSFFNIYGALINGAELILCSRENLLELNYISNLVKEKKVTKFFVTTALFNIWIDNIPEAFVDVKCIVFGGEKASEKHCVKALQYLKSGNIINGYGPTESTVFTTAYVMHKVEDITDNIPIGKIITNTKVYILSSNDKASPIGVPGELSISGDGLVKGYLKNIELTNKKFTKNPMDSSTIIYRTGDLARWTESGNIEFLGRIDNQVKINGYRIELEEIESNLKKHKVINEAVVIAKEKENGEKYLIAYVLLENDDIGINSIKEWLIEFLPKYMIPKNIVIVDKMPLNKNGKVDRNELQKLEEESKDTTTLVYDKQLTPKQKDIIEIVQKVLGKENIELNDDFFELGGDSIKAIQLSAGLKKKGIKLDVKDIFIKSIIHEMACCCKELSQDICQEAIIGEVKLLPNARYFIENNDDLNYFTQSILLDCKEKLDIECLRKAFERLLVMHDMLRAYYKNNNVWVKDINKEELFDLNLFDCSDQSDAEEYIVEKIKEIKASTNLRTGPLVKVALFDINEGCQLMISIHHFVVDTVSFRILIEDLVELYRGYLNGEEFDMLSKTNSFKDWVSSLEYYIQASEFERQEEYWSEIEKETYTEIKGITNPAKRLNENMGKCEIQLSEQLTVDLLQKANKPYNTETKHVLIAAIGMAINKVFNVKDKTRILLEGHGREMLFEHMDLSRTVGWFTSLYPIILDLSSADNIKAMVMNTKDNINNIPNNGIGYGLWKYMKQEGSTPLQNRCEEISFNYLGELDNNINDELFSISSIKNNSDQSKDMCMLAKLEITAAIYNKCMNLEISYDKNEFTQSKIQQFLSSIVKSIKATVKHCLNKDEVILTLSDLPKQDISIEEILDIQNMFQSS